MIGSFAWPESFIVNTSPSYYDCNRRAALCAPSSRPACPHRSLSVNLWATWWNVAVGDAEVGEVPGELRSNGAVAVRLNSVNSERRCSGLSYNLIRWFGL